MVINRILFIINLWIVFGVSMSFHKCSIVLRSNFYADQSRIFFSLNNFGCVHSVIVMHKMHVSCKLLSKCFHYISHNISTYVISRKGTPNHNLSSTMFQSLCSLSTVLAYHLIIFCWNSVHHFKVLFVKILEDNWNFNLIQILFFDISGFFTGILSYKFCLFSRLLFSPLDTLTLKY